MLINEDNFAYAMMCLEANDEVAVDTETSGLNVRYGTDYLMGFCFAVEGFKCYMPFRHREKNVPMRYLPHVEKLLQTKDLIWHNRKFDMHSVKTIGIDPLLFTGRQYDTMIIAHLVNEELYSKELDFLAKWFLKEGKLDKDEAMGFGKAFGFENVPVEFYEHYGPQDADLTRRLKDVLWPLLLKQEGLEKVYWETEEPFTRLLYKLEQRAVGVNGDFAAEKAEHGRSRMATIYRELKFNPASPKEIGQYLIEDLGLPVLAHTDSCDECKAGKPVHSHDSKPSFNKRVMEDYDDILQASENPTAQRIGEYRGWQKAVTSLYEPLLERSSNGLIRTNFKQHGTVTGRLSAEHPNLQQVPRGSDKPWNGNAKSAFHSGRDEHVLIGWDYSQLELRLAAAYGSESILLAEFEKDKADPFSALAPLIFGILTPETRHDTKTFVYANLYGAGLRKIAAQLGRDLEEVKELYQNYHNSIPGIMEVSQRVTQLVEQRGFVKYWDGRRRHMKNKADAYKAWNSVCQGGGAQLVKKAMLRCEEFESDDCMMVLQVHDEITFSIDKGKIDYYEPMIKDAMTQWGDTFGVRMAVDGKEWK